MSLGGYGLFMLADRLKNYVALLASIPLNSLNAVVQAITEVPSGRTIYVAGNGGSCANAAHLVLHLREVGFRAEDLSGDNVYLTALANDHSYAQIFSHRIRRYASPNDLLVVISGSGESPNIIMALAEAKRSGLKTLGLLGFGGGMASALCDVAVTLASWDYGPVEVAHDACIHLIKELLADGIDKSGI